MQVDIIAHLHMGIYTDLMVIVGNSRYIHPNEYNLWDSFL